MAEVAQRSIAIGSPFSQMPKYDTRYEMMLVRYKWYCFNEVGLVLKLVVAAVAFLSLPPRNSLSKGLRVGYTCI